MFLPPTLYLQSSSSHLYLLQFSSQALSKSMAEEEDRGKVRPELPIGRVNKIMKLDRDINKVSSEALFLVSCSTELFLRFLAGRSAEIAIEKKRKTVKLEHIRMAVKRHPPTSDFLLDSLPSPSQQSDHPPTERSRSHSVSDNPAPVGTRRIDDFFHKPTNEVQVQNNES